MRILRIVGILGLVAISVVVLRNKICASDVTISFIELVVDNVCNKFIIS